MLDVNYLKSNGVDVDKSLELFGDWDIYNETFQDYLDGIAEKLDNLKKFKELNDMPNYAIYAHSIKSDARYLGFTDVAKIALDHEMAGKEGNENFVMKNYQELVDVTNKMTNIVNNYLHGSESSVETLDPIKEIDDNEYPNEFADLAGQEKSDFVVDNSYSEAIKSVENQKEVIVEPTPSPIITETKSVVIVAADPKSVTNFVIKSLNNKYDVVVASDGGEAINLIGNPSYHVIGLLLDLNMPKVSGFEVLDYFNKNNLFSKIPVSIITGEDSKDMITKAFNYHIVDMLVKPFSEQDVNRVVDKTVNFLNN